MSRKRRIFLIKNEFTRFFFHPSSRISYLLRRSYDNFPERKHIATRGIFPRQHNPLRYRISGLPSYTERFSALPFFHNTYEEYPKYNRSNVRLSIHLQSTVSYINPHFQARFYKILRGRRFPFRKLWRLRIAAKRPPLSDGSKRFWEGFSNGFLDPMQNFP